MEDERLSGDSYLVLEVLNQISKNPGNTYGEILEVLKTKKLGLSHLWNRVLVVLVALHEREMIVLKDAINDPCKAKKYKITEKGKKIIEKFSSEKELNSES